MPNLQDLEQIPSNVESERAYLSCLFQEPSLIYSSPIELKHFYDNMNKRIYKKMLSLKKEDISIDTFTLWDDFDNDCIYDIASLVMTTYKFNDYIDVMLEYYNRRQIKQSCQRLDQACSKEDDFERVLERLNTMLKKVEWTEKVKTLVPWIYETIEELKKKDNLLMIGKTWYDSIDEYIWWYRPWAFYLLGARPWVGKSTLMMNLMLKAINQWLQCAIFSLEMIDTEIHTRVMCCLSEVEQWEIEDKDPKLLEKVWENVASYGINEQCNIYDDVKYLEDIERLIAKEASSGAKIIYIDYVQLIRTKRNMWSTNAMLEEISSSLKWLAQKYRIAIFWLAQLNRSMEEGEIPQLKHLRGSGWLEQDVDVCLMLHNIKVDSVFWEKYKCEEDEVACDIVKNRQGTQWHIVFAYKKPYFLIKDKDA